MYLYCLICLIFLYVSILSAMNSLDMALCKINIIDVMDRNQCLHLAINGYAGSVN